MWKGGLCSIVPYWRRARLIYGTSISPRPELLAVFYVSAPILASLSASLAHTLILTRHEFCEDTEDQLGSSNSPTQHTFETIEQGNSQPRISPQWTASHYYRLLPLLDVFSAKPPLPKVSTLFHHHSRNTMAISPTSHHYQIKIYRHATVTSRRSGSSKRPMWPGNAIRNVLSCLLPELRILNRQQKN